MGQSKRSTTKSASGIWKSVILILLLITSCTKEKVLPTWMNGKWESTFNKINICETWELKGEKMVGSTVWSFEGKKRVDAISISFNKDTLEYFASFENEKPICFKCFDTESDTLVFINNQNDFPKRIVYVRSNGKIMRVWIDNEENDPNRINFPFEKIPS